MEPVLEIVKKHIPDSVKYRLKVLRNDAHYSVMDMDNESKSLAIERFMVKVGLFKKRCGSCKNFNYEHGQEIFNSNAIFRRVAVTLSPKQMIKVEQSDVRPDPDNPSEVMVDKDDTDPSVFNPPQATNQWNDLGYCHAYECGEFRYKSFVLDENKNRIPCPRWR